MLRIGGEKPFFPANLLADFAGNLVYFIFINLFLFIVYKVQNYNFIALKNIFNEWLNLIEKRYDFVKGTTYKNKWQ